MVVLSRNELDSFLTSVLLSFAKAWRKICAAVVYHEVGACGLDATIGPYDLLVGQIIQLLASVQDCLCILSF